jgi:hypothetical protein
MHQLARLLCEARSSREINMVLQLGVSALCRGGAPTCFDQCLPCVAGCMRIERQVALLHLQPKERNVGLSPPTHMLLLCMAMRDWGCRHRQPSPR